MKEFEYIAKDIISNERFLSLKNEPHHGITRYDHIMHVAKCTYKIAKGLHLDYVAATRGALLHDYFTNVDKSVAVYECGLHKWREKLAVMVIFLINLVRF